ncbi:ATP-binding protein [Endozoicomonas sp.]|uniref:ATP-binding protein n=1 Tax=Endozoicomonas sp. TaxID=1892382 RepID=UPI002887F0A1|nr:ATP-binding protein [Endozoicomonas sp.]
MRLIESLKGRVTIAVTLLLIISFSLVLISVLSSFNETIERTTREQMASNANTMLAAVAREENGQLVMPEQLSDKRFNTPGADNLLGYIYDASGHLVWQSMSTNGNPISYTPDFDLEKRVTFKILQLEGKPFLAYEVDTLLSRKSPGYSFVTIVPAQRYFAIIDVFKNHLRIWISLVSLLILGTFWLALWWSLKPFRQVSKQLNDIESGHRQFLHGAFPTEVKRLTDSINTLLVSEQKQREKYRTTMDDLTHSLKTPLVVLQSFSNTLKIQSDNPNKETILELCHNLNTQVNRMNQIIGYHLHRTITGQLGLTRQVVQIQPLINDLRNTLTKVYLEKQVNTQINLDPSCLFHGDEGDFLEIMGNLMENAFKFCKTAVSVTGYIQTTPQKPSGELILIIEDDGPGIAEEEHKRVFQRGIRADCQKPGQGIGLAIVRDLIEGYEGHIAITESAMGGALIKISLP